LFLLRSLPFNNRTLQVFEFVAEDQN